MPIGILNNIASLSAENQLSITNSNLQSTLYQLSSGSRINSGADDAAGLAIANGLQANVTALTQSARNATDGVGKLQVADGALSQVTTLLNRAVTLATESANGTVSDAQRQALEAEFAQIKAEVDRIGNNTTYNGSQVFAGGQTNFNQVVGRQRTARAGHGCNGQCDLENVDSRRRHAQRSSDHHRRDAGTVAGLIENINSSGSGLFATLDNTGHLMITDAENRGSDAGTRWSTAVRQR